jgi:hypothetical protein
MASSFFINQLNNQTPAWVGNVMNVPYWVTRYVDFSYALGCFKRRCVLNVYCELFQHGSVVSLSSLPC